MSILQEINTEEENRTQTQSDEGSGISSDLGSNEIENTSSNNSFENEEKQQQEEEEEEAEEDDDDEDDYDDKEDEDEDDEYEEVSSEEEKKEKKITLRLIHNTIIDIVKNNIKTSVQEIRRELNKELNSSATKMIQSYFVSLESYLESRFPFLMYFDKGLKKKLVVLDEKCQGVTSVALLTIDEQKTVSKIKEKKQEQRQQRRNVNKKNYYEQSEDNLEFFPTLKTLGKRASKFKVQEHLVQYLEIYLFVNGKVRFQKIEKLFNDLIEEEPLVFKISNRYSTFIKYFRKVDYKNLFFKKGMIFLANRKKNKIEKQYKNLQNSPKFEYQQIYENENQFVKGKERGRERGREREREREKEDNSMEKRNSLTKDLYEQITTIEMEVGLLKKMIKNANRQIKEKNKRINFLKSTLKITNEDTLNKNTNNNSKETLLQKFNELDLEIKKFCN
ncbi:hypothetical protein M0813_02443 [Anaeramoeba flamelloides]|uniref:Uncharacterized protein n=1 Tax=Anaeramoeba flamelloides TaxID=1746091 RepID=A0ABQ8YDD1_9EUKA|nr:hypothetical protein M0813_02443 [Anaeramoeba flamelloides]